MNSILATYLITKYATDEGLAGPFDTLDRFRAAMKSASPTTAGIVDCPFCFSIYAALLVALLPPKVCNVLAAAGGVCVAYTALNTVQDGVDWMAEYVQPSDEQDEG